MSDLEGRDALGHAGAGAPSPGTGLEHAHGGPQAGATVRVNGDVVALPVEATIGALLVQLGLGERRVAVAVNRSVVPRSTHAGARIEAGDQIEILEAVGGG